MLLALFVAYRFPLVAFLVVFEEVVLKVVQLRDACLLLFDFCVELLYLVGVFLRKPEQ